MTPEGYVLINKYIDVKPMFGNWEIDTLMVFSVFFGLAVIFSKEFLSFAVLFSIGIIVSSIYNKIKKSKIKGYFYHILYMIGIRKPKTLPPSYMRIFLGA